MSVAATTLDGATFNLSLTVDLARDHGEAAEAFAQKVRLRCRGTSLIRNTPPLGSYSKTLPRALWWPKGGMLLFMSGVPLYGTYKAVKARFWSVRPLDLARDHGEGAEAFAQKVFF